MSAQESDVQLRNSTPGWEIQPIPDDFHVEVNEEFSHPHQVSVEAFWNGEAKVSSDVSFFGSKAYLDHVGRPRHWGEDFRTPEEQLQEYMLGLDIIIKQVSAMDIRTIESVSQSGPIALAMMNLKPPMGWDKKFRLDSWMTGENLDVNQAVIDGAEVSFFYEKVIAPVSDLGTVAISGANQQSFELSAA